jgi:hypothetical protein
MESHTNSTTFSNVNIITDGEYAHCQLSGKQKGGGETPDDALT